MITVEGLYNKAIIMTDDVEDYAIAQVKQLCDLECNRGNKIVCMPDIHPGKVSTIGFTMSMDIYSPIMPALIGNDIGCGVTTVKLDIKRKPEFKKLDVVIRENIPVGMHKRNSIHPYYWDWKNNPHNLIHAYTKEDRVSSSLGTLGGGNHFIEIDKDNDNYYLTIHSGSRSLGQQVFDYWMDVADETVNGNGIGRNTTRELTYLKDASDVFYYMNDVKSCIRFASMNRLVIIDEICKGMKWKYSNLIDTHHNYIEDLDLNNRIIRKGAIGANKDQDVIIPINMKDGIIIGKGKGDEKYNYSAPHGAGRILSRSEVKNHHTLNEFKTVMNGIYSPTISKNTLDEAPFAYRSIDHIIPFIQQTVDITNIIKPIYNYKGV